jgi:protein-tyrosine phosphatase
MEKNIIIDFHAHILPGMDHGCEDVAMSLAQLKMAKEHKIDVIIATSHFYPHIETVTSFLGRRKEAWDSLSTAMLPGSPDILLGAEVLLCNRIDKMEGIEDLCIENSNILLLEMPYQTHWEERLIDTVVRLRADRGLEVILAHPERYPAKEINKILDQGFQVQLNVASTAKLFPSSIISKCMKQQCVAAYGSDIHGLHNCYQAFTKSMKKWGEGAELVMEKTRKLIVSKEDLSVG